MGLAAGQARLLSITARKSDCEFQSMRLSHQKIAMARELADLSNEYQNSLNQTKLIYDYYGSGDTSTPLTYGLMMEPSALNDYMPIMLTSSDGRVVLNNKLALAARAAGIPQEGLGTLPSEELRNRFIDGLASVGVLQGDLPERIKNLPYSQGVGFGSGEIVVTHTEDINLTTLIDRLKEQTDNKKINSNDLDKYELKNAKGDSDKSCLDLAIGTSGNFSSLAENSGRQNYSVSADINVADLLKNDDGKEYFLSYKGPRGEQSPVLGISMMQKYLTDSGGFVDWLMEEFSKLLDIGGLSTTALEYAYKETINLINPPVLRDDGGTWQEYWYHHEATKGNGDEAGGGKDLDEETSWSHDGKNPSPHSHAPNDRAVNAYLNASGTPHSCDGDHCGSDDENFQPGIVAESQLFMGFRFVNGINGGGDNGNDHATAGISLNNIAKAFLTYFADVMNGTATTDEYGNQVYNVQKGSISGNRLVNENSMFTVKLGTEVSSDDLGQAAFYNAMFNQICAHGWVENDEVNDKDYLKQMLQSGRMFISKIKDDNYYYQGNYATDSYIKEIPDESLIAYAEAKYNTQKAKLNSKEETIDLKMKNLDTEISSLTTEYDTVKNTISKNIEKSFKRFNA